MSSAGQGPCPEDPEIDSTGIRKLLSSLPDPGPMPDHVTARIAASLDRERDARSARAAWGPYSADAGIADVRGERGRRQLRPLLIASAAVVAAGIVGALVVDRLIDPYLTTSDAAAQYTPAQSETQNASQDRAVSERETQGLRSHPIAEMGDVAFAQGALGVLEAGTDGNTVRSAPLPPGFAVTSKGAVPLTADQRANCVRSAGQEPTHQEWVAVAASVLGEPVVLVGSPDHSSPRAWAVNADCQDNASAKVLIGPARLP